MVKRCGPEGQNKSNPPPSFSHIPDADFLTKKICMKPGSIICCIDDGGWSQWVHREFTSLPTKDSLYVVRRVIPNWVDPKEPPGIAVEEIFAVGPYLKLIVDKPFLKSTISEKIGSRRSKLPIISTTFL